MAFVASSHVGKVRKANQDYYYANEREKFCLYAVADGMGGHNAGEVASYLAINSIVSWIEENADDLIKRIGLAESDSILSFIKDSIDFANKKVFQKAMDNNELFGMGTTITLSLIIDNNLYIGHVGDSRAYIINEQKITQLTQDHSLVAELYKNGSITFDEAANHPQRHLLTRAIGTEEHITIDTLMCKLEKEDLLLLCTDGLTNLINDGQILDIVINNNIYEGCEKLIDYANSQGGSDNITAILIKYLDKM